jgi:acetyl esterase
MPLHPQVQAIIEGMAANPDAKATHEQTPEEAREAYVALGGAFGPGEDVGSVADRNLPGPAGEIPARVYTPSGEGPFPVLVFYHGGGFVIGDLDSHDKECRALCNGAGCVVVAVHYRLAPEHRYPAAVEDAWAALEWVAANAGEVGGDASRIAVGGDSAGGNLAAVVSLLSRDRGGPRLALQLLVYPCTDATPDAPFPSRSENAAGPFLLKETMDYFFGHYVDDPSPDWHDPRLSPLYAKSHAELAPALIVTAEFDPLRDEGEAYAEKLRAAGVPVELRRYDGMPHVFFQLSPAVDAGRQLLDQASMALRKAFG